MPVDSAAARREARRRKILGDPEKRLHKIVSCDTTRAGDVVATTHSLGNLWEHCNGVDDPITQEEFELVKPFPKTLSSLNEIKGTEEFESVNEISRLNPLQDEIRSGMLAGNGETVVLPGETIANSEIVGDKNQFLFWSDCFFIVFTSVIVRLMYAFNMSSLFAESLYLPFVTVFIAKLAANPSKHSSKSIRCGGMIRASLLLSGVSKNWLDKIFLCVQTCIELGHDFALYFFSFTVTHIFLESFVNR